MNEYRMCVVLFEAYEKWKIAGRPRREEGANHPQAIEGVTLRMSRERRAAGNASATS